MPSSLSSKLAARPPRRVVIKLGTGVLTSGIGQLDTARIAAVCGEVAALRARGTEVIIVSSGAVGLGMGALELTKKPRELPKKQACAAIGQSLLMQTWQAGFAPHVLTVAQVLLTHEDLRGRARYLGVRETLKQLISYGTIPVINENDTVSAAEIKFGDNDTLSALVASLMGAQYLIILSTAPGLIDLRGTKQIVPVVEKITPEIEAMAGGTTSETAVGGMISKISAAKLATRSGCGVFIASGAEPLVIARLLSGRGPGTFFVPSGLPLEARKRWLAYFQRPTGTLYVNACAVPVLREQGRSLLAVGVTGSMGKFAAGEIVNIAGPDGTVFARGKCAYASDEIAALAGKHGDEMIALHPSRKHHEVVHRNDLVLL
ncbi:glutamate 5-kinase [Opitutus terrae]|uniref:Glutamate 5-kinase n=1 Tax=Opitutus terrae (strain DSM 11246 / JCM 15787 / PB90-1) TaxID=452637 RepID=B2A091_OPITP|nr:glutamate 5-kinase [Opitutus terrae]ACB77427.1 glutamate 5-kinase [Opitutus terrae PB90-1]